MLSTEPYNPPMTALTLIPDFDLTAHNTLALAARSRFGVRIERAEDCPALYALAAERKLPLRILGGGSNVVLSRDFDGITAPVMLTSAVMPSKSRESTTLLPPPRMRSGSFRSAARA